MRYCVQQRSRYDAVAISRLRDRFVVAVWSGRWWIPDPRVERNAPVNKTFKAGFRNRKRRRPRAGRLW